MMRTSFASDAGQRAEVVAAIAARLDSHAPAGLAGEGFQCLGVMLGPTRSSAPTDRSVGAGLVADGLQLGHAFLEQRVGHVGDSVFDPRLWQGSQIRRTADVYATSRHAAAVRN
jgi:hypothetical protein